MPNSSRGGRGRSGYPTDPYVSPEDESQDPDDYSRRTDDSVPLDEETVQSLQDEDSPDSSDDGEEESEVDILRRIVSGGSRPEEEGGDMPEKIDSSLANSQDDELRSEQDEIPARSYDTKGDEPEYSSVSASGNNQESDNSAPPPPQSDEPPLNINHEINNDIPHASSEELSAAGDSDESKLPEDSAFLADDQADGKNILVNEKDDSSRDQEPVTASAGNDDGRQGSNDTDTQTKESYKMATKKKTSRMRIHPRVTSSSDDSSVEPPSREVSASTGSTTKKRRGRPPKPASAVTGKATTKKKRGRPPKVATAATQSTTKKKRGRPPKSATDSIQSTTKKKRGRPPKAATAASKGAATSKRGRGRPPKSASIRATATGTGRRGRPRKTGILGAESSIAPGITAASVKAIYESNLKLETRLVETTERLMEAETLLKERDRNERKLRGIISEQEKDLARIMERMTKRAAEIEGLSSGSETKRRSAVKKSSSKKKAVAKKKSGSKRRGRPPKAAAR